MTRTGTIVGRSIEFDEPLPMRDGTRVQVHITPTATPRRGSPEAVLRAAGTLTDEEADLILRCASDCRRIDESLWRDEE